MIRAGRPGPLSLLLLPILFLLLACGYHRSGAVTTLPSDVRTIAIPGFDSQSTTYKVEQTLTGAVVHEFRTRTHYHVINNTSDDADATLKGTVAAVYAQPITFDTRTGRVATVMMTVVTKISLTNRDGKVLFENPAYSFREQYQVSADPASFFEEQSPALARLSQNFAHALVRDILEGY
jgi:outer membrane lipopolysaccharide assembly protein LptE/RlpB